MGHKKKKKVATPTHTSRKSKYSWSWKTEDELQNSNDSQSMVSTVFCDQDPRMRASFQVDLNPSTTMVYKERISCNPTPNQWVLVENDEEMYKQKSVSMA